MQNVHLAPAWLVSLEKTKLHTLHAAAGFRLFMSLEITPKIPVNLVRASRTLVFEPPPGIKASIIHTMHHIPRARMERPPIERARLYFLLAWLHALVHERLRYAPIGWTKPYEISDVDMRVAMDTLDSLVDAAAKGRSNVAPEAIPWAAVRELLVTSVYGGRMDNEFDQRLLVDLVARLFTPRSFDLAFPLIPDGSIALPDARDRQAYEQWVHALPDQQGPAWLGLAKDADATLMTTRGIRLVAKTARVQSLDDVWAGEDQKGVYGTLLRK